MNLRPALATYMAACTGGLLFSSLSTYDFVQHLDRQTHALHCSFVPGAALDASGASGCHAALMSTWSSVLRGMVWGGIPSALAGMGVFAFLLFRALKVWFGDRQDDRGHARFLLLATLLPVATSLFYAGISAFVLKELCKVCLGIYLSSFVALVAALMHARDAQAEDGPESTFQHRLLGGAAEGASFVLAPLVLYVAMAPDFSKYIGTCGTLLKPEDPNGVMVPLDPHPGAKAAIEVLDPLCPVCSAMEERLVGSGFDVQLDRKAVLFPLDKSCNWMVGTTVHAGACTVSEAVMCAGDKAKAVITWAFEHSEEIRTASEADPAAAKQMVTAAFPELGACVGSEKVRQRLNRALRWSVANQLPVLTPQLYIENRKVCAEDTDLGLEWTLSRMLTLAPAKEAR